ncbi:hypothetical protein HYP99_gp030 [Sinorhizobium phage ort11]|uniref:Uncharacterized protein n=1 Tax=Sinorhizobium phage ort11 TaxID=2599764 RepID=A0A5C2H187_9CAUD|nr:hypothetical protein HYP99_gp030 [Sinorhizobium phage ort11]QEP29828.1 hypothetical protein Smphiort11_030 [Sinorhizobium phage ort11]
MPEVSITLGKGSAITLMEHETIHITSESRGQREMSIFLCNATKQGISNVQKYLEQMKVFVPDE